MHRKSPTYSVTPKPVLVTGAAGFVGSHLANRLLGLGRQVVGVDNLNTYYSRSLKRARLDRLNGHESFSFHRLDITEPDDLDQLIGTVQPEVIVNLAAQVGVRASLERPAAYLRDNLLGFGHVLDCAQRHGVQQLLYASSSSVYGGLPVQGAYRTDLPADEPLNLYAATKRANELLAYSYGALYGLATVGLRFFTVYGPWGRPDMLYFKIAEAMRENREIEIYGTGDQARDFTYVDDVIDAIVALMRPSSRPVEVARVFNVGCGTQSTVNEMIDIFEANLGTRARRRYLPAAAGDMYSTLADVDDLERATGIRPRIPLTEGIERFLDWYQNYEPRAEVVDQRQCAPPTPAATDLLTSIPVKNGTP